MPLTVQVRSRSQALTEVAGALSLVGSQPLIEEGLIAAHLRGTCEAHAAREREGIHTLALTESVVRNLAGLLHDSENLRAHVHLVRERLHATGDLWRSTGGYWRPTPARAVTLASGHAFLLGTFAASNDGWVASGAVRFASGELPSGLPTQALDDWLGQQDSIAVWTNRALQFYAAKLQPAGVSAAHLQVYAPDQAGPYRSRWLEPEAFAANKVDLRLCRATATKNAIYNRPYFLGEFSSERGTLHLLRAAEVAHNHARRLRFGFDDRLAAVRLLRPKYQGDSVYLAIANDLPVEEERVLALGLPNKETPSPAVKHMRFPIQAIPFVAHALGRLGMLIEGERR